MPMTSEQMRTHLAEQGNVTRFTGLFDLAERRRVRAKLVHRDGAEWWEFYDALDQPTGRYIRAFQPWRRLEKRGFREFLEPAPCAVAVDEAGGWKIVRSDRGYPEDAKEAE